MDRSAIAAIDFNEAGKRQDMPVLPSPDIVDKLVRKSVLGVRFY